MIMMAVTVLKHVTIIQCWDGSCVDDMANCPDEPVVPQATGVCIAGENYAGYPAVTVFMGYRNCMW